MHGESSDSRIAENSGLVGVNWSNIVFLVVLFSLILAVAARDSLAAAGNRFLYMTFDGLVALHAASTQVITNPKQFLQSKFHVQRPSSFFVNQKTTLPDIDIECASVCSISQSPTRPRSMNLSVASFTPSLAPSIESSAPSIFLSSTIAPHSSLSMASFLSGNDTSRRSIVSNSSAMSQVRLEVTVDNYNTRSHVAELTVVPTTF